MSRKGVLKRGGVWLTTRRKVWEGGGGWPRQSISNKRHMLPEETYLLCYMPNCRK